MDLGSLWHREAAVTEQDHVGTQSHPSHRLPAYLVQLLPLVIGQMKEMAAAILWAMTGSESYRLLRR
jgi:hypothetical protein